MQEPVPTIRASFILDGNGKPICEAGRHFHIKIYVRDVPADTYAVTYQLDPTYYEPVREVRNKADAFREEITSYGDYDIIARVRTRSSSSLTLRRSLYEALAETHQSDTSPEIVKALERIRGN